MKNKMLLPIMLVVVLTLVLLAGCAKKADPIMSAVPAASTDATTSAAPTLEPAATAPAIKDGNITVLYYTSKADYEKNKTTNPNAYDAVWETIPQFEQQFGGKVTLKVVPFDKQRDTLITMVNAGEQADVVPASDQFFPIYPVKKLVQPIDQYIKLTDPLWNQAVTKAFSFAGKPYAAGASAVPVVIYYNKDLFEKNGVKTPSEYYAEGNWTWETFRDVAKQLTMDTDGDGKNDQFGFNWWDGGYAMFVASNGKTLLSYNDDGSITSNLETDNVKEALQFVQDAYLKDKYIDIAQDGDKFVAAFKNGKLAMTGEFGLNGFTTLKASYNIDYVPIPKGPKGEQDAAHGGLGGWSIPTVSKNPEAAAAFIQMVSENALKAGTAANVKGYGQEQADKINELAGKILFTPIGIEKYWDANTLIITSIKKGTPIGTFVPQAKSITEQGIKITLTQ
jgi:multiple sugar transport system substrate-binding protein